MDVIISATKGITGFRAATYGATLMRTAIRQHGHTRIILATGASQFEMLSSLVTAQDIDWSRVTAFHLDEYIGLSVDHPASFRRYLRERFVEALPGPIGKFHYIDAEDFPENECRRLNPIISSGPIDVAFIGIGENGHFAFNDPPADFEKENPYIIVDLDEACRKQQLEEGWFNSLGDVPRRAISMSVRQIMNARSIVCTVPDERKAHAVQNAVEGPVTANIPASILQDHPHCRLYLDSAAASRLSPNPP